MGTFFRTAIDDHLLNNAPAILDWLFDDKKFESNHWTRGAKRKLTNQMSESYGCPLQSLPGKQAATCIQKSNQREIARDSLTPFFQAADLSNKISSGIYETESRMAKPSSTRLKRPTISK